MEYAMIYVLAIILRDLLGQEISTPDGNPHTCQAFFILTAHRQGDPSSFDQSFELLTLAIRPYSL